MNKTMKPQIRFKGFDEEWKEKTLGEMMGVGSVKRIHQEDWKGSGVRFLRARDIVAALKGEEIEDKLYIDANQYEEYSAISGKVEPGDLLVTGVGTIGIPYLIKGDEPIYFKDGNIIWFKNSNFLDGSFFFYSFIAGAIQDYILKSSTVGTVGTYTIECGKSTPISYPSLLEQKAIGEYFKQTDGLIGELEREIGRLEKMKQASLQKMFPRPGETTPEIRFEGFEGKWREDLIGCICDVTTGSSNTQDQVPKGEYPFFIRSADVARSSKYIFDCEAVITIGDGQIGKVFHYYNGKFDLHQRCYVMYNFQNIEARYFYYYFSTFFYKRAMKMTAKATVDSVRMEMITEMPVFYPSLPEQKAIGEYFRNLDELIAAKRQKLEKLRNIKKACLDKMFVNSGKV